MNAKNDEEDRRAFVAEHGARVRRTEAMALLGIRDKHTFTKVVDANPQMRHKLPGEGQAKYLTSVIFELLPHRVSGGAPETTPEAGCAPPDVRSEGRLIN